MKNSLAVIFILSNLWVNAQFLSPYNTMVLDTGKQLSVGLLADAFVNSNAINAKLVNGFFKGGYISREERSNMLNRANSNNSEGVRGYGAFFYCHRLDSIFKQPLSGINLFFQAKHRIENYASFSKNALELALFGNKRFVGSTTPFTPLEYTELQFQQFQLGFAKNNLSQFSYYFGASVLVGQKARHLMTNSLEIYTSTSGDTLDLNAIGRFEESNPDNNSFIGNNGIGVSFDFGINMPVQILNDNFQSAQLEISVADIGFIGWYNTSQQQTIDTTYTYYGAYYTNIFDPSAAIFYQDPGLLIDSLSHTSNKNFTINLPSSINVELSQSYKSWKFFIQGTFRNFAHYQPFFSLSGTKQINEKWLVGAQLNTGGYGTFGGGVFTQFTHEKSTIKFGSHQIEGFLFPNKTAGQQLFFLYSYTI